MKPILRMIFPAVLLLTLLSPSALAQTKIATVDMRQLFDNYYKTRLAQAALQERSAQLTKDDSSMKDDLKKATDDYQRLLEQVNDPAISVDERDRRKQAATDKLKQLGDRRAAIEQFARTGQATLSDQLQHMSEKIRADIQAAVNSRAKAGGYAIVLNTASEGINLGSASITVPSPVVYSIGGIDMTAEVLKQLNAGAPIDMNTTNSAPAISPVLPQFNTNGP
jgi:outer membrane protein